MYVCEISTKQPVNMLLGSQHPLRIWFVCILPLYSAWGAGAACDHSQVKDSSLTCSSFEFAFKKMVIFLSEIKKKTTCTKWSNICHSVVSNWVQNCYTKSILTVNTFHAVKVLQKKSWVLALKQASWPFPYKAILERSNKAKLMITLLHQNSTWLSPLLVSHFYLVGTSYFSYKEFKNCVHFW